MVMLRGTRVLGSLTLGGWLALSAALAGTVSAQQETRTRSPTATQSARDGWQRAPDIFEAMDIREGSVAADVGAGEGWLTTRLARHVGDAGQVFAVDLDQLSLRRLRSTLDSESLHNVEVVVGEVDDPRLPADSLDAIIVLNAYHEMTRFEAMLDGFRRALRPGGRLVIVDNVPDDTTASRRRQTSAHRLWIGLAEADLTTAGFEVIRREPDFIERVGGRSHGQWLLVARRPSSE